MTWWWWLAVAAGAVVVAWTTLVLFLLRIGRRSEARAVAGFVPDCLVLVRRLLADPGVSRRRKLLLLGLLAYLAFPFDLVPDFIPVAGQLDDVMMVAFVLRSFLRSGGEQVVRRHWPGPDESLGLVLRVAGR